MSVLVIDFEGFQLPSGNYIVKELAFHAVKGNPLTGVCTFQSPFPFEDLTIREKIQYSWIARNIHRIDWNQGELPYFKFRTILMFLCDMFSNIYVKGLEKKKFLEFLTGRVCHNLEDLGCPKVNELLPTLSSCTVHSTDFKHCALVKAKAFGRFLQEL